MLIDKYPACGQGNTSKSNACYRNVFDTELNIQLCNASIEYYKEIQKSINLGLIEVGYLWLLNEEQMQSRRNKTIKQLGTDRVFSLLDFLDVQKVRYKIFSQEELRKIFPTLNINEEIQYGLLGFKCGTLATDLVVKY